MATCTGLALVLAACGSAEAADTTAPIIVIDGAEATEIADEATTTSAAAAETTDDDAAVAAETTDDGAAASASEATDEELAFAFADCLRDEGLDVNDPTVNADGSVSLQSLFGGGPPPAGEDTESALEACGDMLDGANFGPAAGADQTEIQDQLVEFAACLRDQGLDVRDPDLSGGIAAAAGGPEALFGLDIQDPQYEAEVEACQGILAFGPGGAGA